MADEHVLPWLQYSDFYGEPCDWTEIETEVSAWDLKETFALFALGSAQAANGQTREELIGRARIGLEQLANANHLGEPAVRPRSVAPEVAERVLLEGQHRRERRTSCYY